MGTEKEFKKVKIFSGIIFNKPDRYFSLKNMMAKIYSPIDLESDEMVFDSTTYYHQEMGAPLFRRFISFSELVYPEQLPEIKITTNQIEKDTSIAGQRVVNIDPGFISEANVIIATTKNYYHRVPLQKGIYAHMEYYVKKNRVQVLPWTYPDFHKPEYQDFFNTLCLLYKQSVYP